MKKRTKILVGFGLLMAALLIAVILAVPAFLSEAEQQVQEKFRQQGIELSFKERSVSFDKIVLRGVNLSRDGGLTVACVVDLIEIDVDVAAALSGEPRLDAVRIAGGTCEATRKSGDTRGAEANDKEAPTRPTVPNFDLLPDLTVQNFKLTLSDASREDTVVVNQFAVESDRISGELSVDARRQRMNLLLAGTISRSKGELSVDISDKSGKIRIKQPLGSATIDALSFRVDAQPFNATVTARTLDVQSLFGSASIEQVDVALAETRRVKIVGADVAVSAAALDFLRDNQSKSQASVAEPRGGNPSTQTGLTIEIANSAVAIQHESKIPLATGINGSIHNGVLSGNASVADGNVSLNARWTRGTLWPKTAQLHFENIALRRLAEVVLSRTEGPAKKADGKVSGTVSGDVLFIGSPNPTVWLAAGLQDGSIDLDGVSDKPVAGIEATAASRVTFDKRLRWAEISGQVGSGGVTIDVDVSVDGIPLAPEVGVVMRGRQADCQTYFDAVPGSIWGRYRNATWEGKAAPQVTFKYPLLSPLKATFLVDGYQECEVTALNSKVAPRVTVDGDKSDVDWLNRAFKKRVIEGVSAGADIVVGPGSNSFVPLASLPKHVGAAAYLSEQTKFYTEGNMVSFGLLQRAVRKNLDGGRFVYGGSTVAQQLVKNLFLVREKTVARKLQEMLISWRLKSVVSLDRILELYLNCIEFGYDIYGIEAAAQHYFQKHAKDLTPRESVFLAMLKPSPKEGERAKKRGHSPTYPWWVERQQVMFDRLVEHEAISQEEADSEKPYGLQWKDGVYVKALPPVQVPILGLDE